ncbi:membrane protein UL56 [Cercopithecine alphaherpesvirus 2]|uniref:Type II membrane protein n=1 Tax=Cercopithecine alphaherpesvirus 2 TaxID=10317 RepID=Q5Y0P5_9ALPH|nr:membrane protein UL56 [Cercopithecine alphaherpesvirus 2]AAU88123.1 type II membrane protein [Cercopithecine alphaherpesvirus 2]
MALSLPQQCLGNWMVLAYEGSRDAGLPLPGGPPPPYSPSPAADAAFVSIDIGEPTDPPPPYSPPAPRGGVRASRRAQRRAARRSRRRAERRERLAALRPRDSGRRAEDSTESSSSSPDAAASPGLPTYREALRDLPPSYDTVVFEDDRDGPDPPTQASPIDPRRADRPSRPPRPPRVSSRELYRYRRAALFRESPRGGCCPSRTHAHVVLGVLLLVVVFLLVFLWR